VNEQDPAAAGRQPTEEELRAAMEEQMRRIRVQDVVIQTVATLVNLGGRRLGLAPEAADERDLEQARLAIEATRALLPLLGAEEARAVREALSQLQVAYAREAGGQAPEAGAAPGAATQQQGAPPQEGGDRPAQGGEQPGQPSPGEAERAKARSRIWTPPGS
jgi:hypothetical protein